MPKMSRSVDDLHAIRFRNEMVRRLKNMPKKQHDPAAMPDDDNPEWTEEMLSRARPAAEVLPQYIGQAATDFLIRRCPGRPPKENRKVNQTLRLDADVLDAYRKQGRGWQAVINDLLRRNMPGSK
jgi:uncharacterized protein (DUF4415 family)